MSIAGEPIDEMETSDNDSNQINKVHFRKFKKFRVEESKDKRSGKKK